MDMKLRNHKEFTSLLTKNGFELQRVSGGHEIWKRNEKETIVVPYHKVNFMIQHRLIKGYKLKEV